MANNILHSYDTIQSSVSRLAEISEIKRIITHIELTTGKYLTQKHFYPLRLYTDNGFCIEIVEVDRESILRALKLVGIQLSEDEKKKILTKRNLRIVI